MGLEGGANRRKPAGNQAVHQLHEHDAARGRRRAIKHLDLGPDSQFDLSDRRVRGLWSASHGGLESKEEVKCTDDLMCVHTKSDSNGC